jgi:transaldolase
MGAHVATLPFAVMKQILHHPLTDMGLEKFLTDWRATKQKI